MSFWETLWEVFHEDCLLLLPILFCTFFLIEYIEHRAGEKFTAALRRFRRTGPLWGSLLGAVLMALVSLPSNYFVVYPAYEVLYGLPMAGIVGMYEAIMGSIAHVPTGNALLNCLVVFNVPFTLCKGLLNVGICLLIYKPLSPLLHK